MTSNIQKRLLRYALSQLDVFDTEVLDLENLDISWGQQNVFNFRNVPLQAKKLAGYLHLPPFFELDKACVRHVRIIIPALLYTRPIVVEVDGVEVRLITLPEDTKSKDRTSPGKTSTPVDPIIPTPADLATSFLQDQSEDEKRKLRAEVTRETYRSCLTATTHELDQDDADLGTGMVPISIVPDVPAYLSSFLQGIIDRLQIKVTNVTFDLVVDLPVGDRISVLSPSHDPVTLRVILEDLEIQGVTSKSKPSLDSDQGDHMQKEGKRLVNFKNLRGLLISDASIFAQLARSSAVVSSPSVVQSTTSADTQRPSRQVRREFTSTADDNLINRSLNSLMFPTDAGLLNDVEDVEDRLETSTSNLLRLRRDSERESILEDSVLLDTIDSNYDPEDVFRPSMHNHEFNPSVLNRSHSATPTATSPRDISESEEDEFFHDATTHDATTSSLEHVRRLRQTTVLPERIQNKYAYDRVSQSHPALIRRTSEPRERKLSPDAIESSTPIESSPTMSPTASPEVDDALAQSSFFSHADAQSMYMSALSHEESPVEDAAHTRRSGDRMPGAWSESVYDFAEPATPSTDLHNIPRQASYDNLEHAIHNKLALDQDEILPSSESASTSNTNERQRHHSFGNMSTTTDAPTSLAKELFTLNCIRVYIPSDVTITENEDNVTIPSTKVKASDLAEEPDHLAASINLAMPGDFPELLSEKSVPIAESVMPAVELARDDPTKLEVDVGILDVHFDVSVGRLLMRTIQRLFQLIRKERSKGPGKSAHTAQSAASESSLNLRIEHISLKFLERLLGQIVYPNEPWNTTCKTPSSTDVLLQASITGLDISSTMLKASKKTHVVVKKFEFGYADESILCFDETLKKHRSGKDLTGMDMHFEFTEDHGTSKLDITTRPMHILIDLLKLDETFSWFGGLSGVLNMGSSMASTITAPVATHNKHKTRSVRFNTPRKPEQRSQLERNKVTMRLGGVFLDLIGKDCIIGAQTSAVKLAYRKDVIGIGIDQITLAGPHIRKFREEPAIVVRLVGTRLDFLAAPDEDRDLGKLLELITPSKHPYDKHDNIMIDTLVRQRRNGSVLRLSLSSLKVKLSNLERLDYLPALGDELAKLSNVTKYLPEDDRPGLLSLILVHEAEVNVAMDNEIGQFNLRVEETEVAHISVPSLIATSIKTISLKRNDVEELIGSATFSTPHVEVQDGEPLIRARMIGNEMEPKVSIQIENVRLEYHVSTIIDILSMSRSTTAEDLATSMSASVATLTAHVISVAQNLREEKPSNPNPMKLDIVVRDSVIGLNPQKLPSKVLVVLTSAHITATVPKDAKLDADVELSKGSILVIDDSAHLTSATRPVLARRHSYDGGSSQTTDLCNMGYVPVAFFSSAGMTLRTSIDESESESSTCIEVDLRSELIIIESCADSTQTLFASFNGLIPPTPPSMAERYRTNVMPITDLLSSLSGDAFTSGTGTGNFEDDFPDVGPEDSIEESILIDSQYIKQNNTHTKPRYEDEEEVLGKEEFLMFDQDDFEGDRVQRAEESSSDLDFADDHFGDDLNSTTGRWSSAKNNYVRMTPKQTRRSPLVVRIRDVHIIWNLFDGYDWQNTRDTITKAVHAVELKAFEKNQGRSDRNRILDMEAEEDNAIIGDCLFNSIYIGIPANGNPRDLTTAINHELNDTATETESVAATTMSSNSRRHTSAVPGLSGKKLRLKRSKRNKITFELQGINVDFVASPPDSGETQSSLDIRVRDLDVFDRVPTSTWKKFATYMHDAGARESGASQVHIALLTVKPVPNLAASEIVMKVTVLPLRLHVDQDALDFITRFFEFKSDATITTTQASDPPFLQRVEVESIQVRLDFKPKRVDYKSLRSGRTTEFMNFVTLDKSDMVMRHCILYGISGFDKLGRALNDIWMPDIKKNQLGGVLAGMAPVRPVIDVLNGFKTLVTVPRQEIRRDGRYLRGLAKGLYAFGSGTGTEALKAGAKIATGVGAMIQGTETYVSGASSSKQREVNPTSDEFGDDSSDDTEIDQYSAYANQPLNISQGMRSAAVSIQKDLRMANGALIAFPAALVEKGTVGGALGAVKDYAPMIILRPFAGLAKGTGQALLGAVNSLDSNNSRQVQDKYKSSS